MKTLNEEIDEFLAAMVEWPENYAIYKFPQDLLNITCNKHSPFLHIKLGQPEDQLLESGEWLGHSPCECFIEMSTLRIPLNCSVKEFRKFLEINKT
jgi:hypothetical protein